MKRTELWKAGYRPSLSFEVFPARTPPGREKLFGTIDELVELGPNFFSVTFGAGGSTRDGWHELMRWLKKDKGQEVLACFAGYGLPPSEVSAVLDAVPWARRRKHARGRAVSRAPEGGSGRAASLHDGSKRIGGGDCEAPGR